MLSMIKLFGENGDNNSQQQHDDSISSCAAAHEIQDP
jgi:hypothetical protein